MRIHTMIALTRLQLGMSQEEIGTRLGYAPTTVSDYERGRGTAPLAYIAALAKLADAEHDPRRPTPPILQAVCTGCPVGCAIDVIGQRRKAA